MRHHEPIIALRKKGKKPSQVYLELATFPACWRQWADINPGDAYVEIEPKDRIEHLDLRFLFGCDVQVSGEDQRRVRDLFAAAQDHGAARVIASCAHPVGETYAHDFILDTKGILTWHN